jgi:membrane-bound lytic murein transglycosylase MltF
VTSASGAGLARLAALGIALALPLVGGAQAPATAAPTTAAGALAAAGRRALEQARSVLARLDAADHERLRRKQDAQFDPIFRAYSKRYFGPGFDYTWFVAQSYAESQWNPRARSRVGARGMMQLMPSTFREIQSARPEFRSIDDPRWNIAAGIMHDRYLFTLWPSTGPDAIRDSDRWAFAFAAYNAGEGTIGRARRTARAAQLDPATWASVEQVAPTVERWRYPETVGYVRRIEAIHDALPKRH